MNLEYSWQIFEKYSTSNFMKTRPMGVELFHVDGQMDGQAGRQTDGHNKNTSRFSQYFESA